MVVAEPLLDNGRSILAQHFGYSTGRFRSHVARLGQLSNLLTPRAPFGVPYVVVSFKALSLSAGVPYP